MADLDGAGAVDAAIAQLVCATLADPAGALDLSIYETARLVSLAPWLAGDAARIAYLLEHQRGDGAWGGPHGYALVPTLSASEALVRASDRVADAAERARVTDAAGRGLAAAHRLLADAGRAGTAPTVIAIFTIPALSQAIDELVAQRPAFSRAWRPDGATPTVMPAGPLAALRDGGFRASPLVGHYLEVVGPAAALDRMFDPGDDFVGCSPAATAAWLGTAPPAAHPALRRLTALQAEHRGAVPTLTSIVFYERAWILRMLLDAGVAPAAVRALGDALPADVGERGAPTAPGLAYEAETTAVVVSARAALGDVQAPAFLWPYDAGSHFRATIPEHAPSTSTNAHVLEALAGYAARGPADAARYADAIRRIASWLRERQRSDGAWTDKWHASAQFATMCCAVALHRHAGDVQRDVVDRAVGWLIGSQRADGGWGEWTATAEETAYAVQTLLHVCPAPAREVAQGVARGVRFLRERGLAGPHPALWLGKELYAPIRLIQAAILGALVLASAREIS